MMRSAVNPISRKTIAALSLFFLLATGAGCHGVRDTAPRADLLIRNSFMTAVAANPIFVNGEQVLRDGEPTPARPGRVVRGPGWKNDK